MTPTPSDAQPVAWRWRYIDPAHPRSWTLRSTEIVTETETDQFCGTECEPLYPQSALDAERQKREAAERDHEQERDLHELTKLRAHTAEASLAKANARIAELADIIRRLLSPKAPLSASAIEENGAVIGHARAALTNIEKERDDAR